MCSFCCISEVIIENNPYEGYFTEQQLKELVKFVDLGQTGDAMELGLDSKFELEAINEFLLKDCGLVLLKVCGIYTWYRVLTRIYDADGVVLEWYIE